MTEHEEVTVVLDMLPDDAEVLAFENGRSPVVAQFEHHAEPVEIAFGEVISVEREDSDE